MRKISNAQIVVGTIFVLAVLCLVTFCTGNSPDTAPVKVSVLEKNDLWLNISYNDDNIKIVDSIPYQGNKVTSVDISPDGLVTFAVHERDRDFDPDIDTTYVAPLADFVKERQNFPDSDDMTKDKRLSRLNKPDALKIGVSPPK